MGTWTVQILKINLATLNVLLDVRMHSKEEKQDLTVKSIPHILKIATSHLHAHRGVLMLQKENNAQVNANSLREIQNAALNVHKTVRTHTPMETPMSSVRNIHIYLSVTESV